MIIDSFWTGLLVGVGATLIVEYFVLRLAIRLTRAAASSRLIAGILGFIGVYHIAGRERGSH